MCQDNKRKGIDLSDKQAHEQDHKTWSRRNFLQTIGLAGATSFSLNMLPITGLYGFPLAGAAAGSGMENRKLVMIRLKGGNDGLNTIVPMYAYDTYRAARPSLSHAEADLIQLNDDFSIPTVMGDLQSLWNQDKMRVINSVGYPNHNLSHFTSADIMASGNNNVNENGDGWLARYYTQLNPDYFENPPDTPPAIKIGGPTSILFNDSNKVDISANFSTADKLAELAETGLIYNNDVAPDDCYYGEQVIFLRTIANAATRYSAAIFDAYTNGTNDMAYTSSLGEQLQLVARLIKGGLNTQLYLVTLDGFDTHVGQNGGGNHLGLLENLSQAVSQFYQDLAIGDHDGDVLAMTYSEFGRRVEENGVSGTDHGTAMPIMLFGPALEGSDVHGKNPDLTDLDISGNLQFGTDFRAIYATILENWFCIEADKVDEILGESYDRLTDIGIACSSTPTSTFRPLEPGHIPSQLMPLGGGQYELTFDMATGADVQVDLVTISGQHILSLSNRYFHQGSHVLSFSLSHLSIDWVPMVYTIRSRRKVVSKQFMASSR
ncbi:MAG: DUF1501 domain-containing protein [Bacteroidota bacterium]